MNCLERQGKITQLQADKARVWDNQIFIKIIDTYKGKTNPTMGKTRLGKLLSKTWTRID